MEFYINPGNGEFAEIRKGEYIDKSGLIAVVNKTIGTERRLSCVSRPRRFGKTFAANLLAAYYDKSCDSSSLFEDLKIASHPGYKEYLNKFNVLYLDMAVFMSEIRNPMDLVPRTRELLVSSVCERLGVEVPANASLPDMLMEFVKKDGDQFVAIIDEWDAPIREPKSTQESQKEYLDFLRGLFKNGPLTKQIFAGVYMTGILPIKKDGSQSPLSDFKEYTMLSPQEFAPYIGYTEDDVKLICEKYSVSYDEMKKWYDGYSLNCKGETISIYNSNSVMEAAYSGEFDSYWRRTSAVNGLRDYINLDYDGLGKAAEMLLAGLEIPVNIKGFQNDMISFETADDVLTLLIHLGYLTYDSENNMARIPNNEVYTEFADMIRKVTHEETIKRIKESDRLIDAIVSMDSDTVADVIQKVHMSESSMKYYNDEQALRAVIKLAFFTYRDYYIKMEELDSGTGYADIVFLSKKNNNYPTLIVELKYNESEQSGLEQIKRMSYSDVVENYGADVLLVGISYNKNDKTKKHSCVIERIEN